MEIEAWERAAVAAYAAGYLSGKLSESNVFNKITAVVDDSGVVTGELHFIFAGWNMSIAVEAHQPVVG